MLTLVAAALLSLPQDPGPRGLTVVVVDVGQGSGAVIQAPDGTVHVFDAGPDQQGSNAMRPAIQRLGPVRYGVAVASHYHSDHIGGLDEVLGLPFTTAWDRGDAARATNPDITNYLNAAGSRRRSVTEGQRIDLGGGATLTVIAHNGRVWNGPVVPVTGTAQEENSRCVAVRIDYGQFAMWIGGDLTGGAGQTADVESPATLACGDVDVYVVDHHGSSTSTNQNLVSRLRPELAVASCGNNNPYGHPTAPTVNRLNQAAAARLMLATTRGTGIVGFGVGGSITITTDGRRYRATAGNGQYLDFFVDERTGAAPLPGDLRLAEIHRDPAAVADGYGEYVELHNVGARPVALKDVQISTRGGTFTIVTNQMLVPGRALVVAPDGDPARNGGLPFGIVWPYQSLFLDDVSDVVQLRLGPTLLDQTGYAAGFPGASGIAAERKDLLGDNSGGNHAAAVTAYGAGDRGSPGRRNAADATPHPARCAVEATPDELAVHASALRFGGFWSVAGLALGDTPGFGFLNAHVPLNPDPLFQLLLPLPGSVARLPAEGYRAVTFALPPQHPLRGQWAYAAHIVLDLGGSGSVAAVSPAVRFQFP
jgi:beta-lactamase superfamily II metal-dependent hydrolase